MHIVYTKKLNIALSAALFVPPSQLLDLRQMLMKKKNKTLWPLFMDGVQLPQVYSHFEEAVYFLLFSSQIQ